MTVDVGDRVARLYGLPLERFTPERNALAAELRHEGDREAADAVKRLRKPTAAAWAANKLVRAEPDLVEALLGAGGELRQAHRQATSGRGAEQLRAAADAERAAVERLVARAPAALGHAPSPALAESIRNTLHAASSDDEARERVASGTLVTEMRPVGLGPVPAERPARSQSSSGTRAAARPRPQVKVAPTEETDEAEVERARELRAAAAAEAALERELDAASRALARAEEAYARARQAADAASERVKEVRKRLREAQTGLRDARRRSARLETGRRK